jgi:DUF1365 family protein
VKSRIYEGWVLHRREAPRPHQFSYRLYLLYLDLGELDHVFEGRWLWSTAGPAVAWFRRQDHFGPAQQDLGEAVRDLVRRELGRPVAGPIRLLTHLRYFGYCMNPVSFYYCWDRDDETVEAVVAEVSNTPWGETHCYVIDMIQSGHAKFRKSFHVSPFMAMDQEYRWRLSRPGATLSVSMQNVESGRRLFSASMALRARDISGAQLARVLVRYPLVTAKVVGAIYWQALRLWIKGTPFHDHPKHLDIQDARQ